MLAPTFIGFSAISIALVSWKLKPKSLRFTLVFLPIFIFLALRFNYGNDYRSYWLLFYEIAGMDWGDYDSNIIRVEFGWFLLNKLFSAFGYFEMIAFLALVNCYVYSRFIAKCVPDKFIWIAIFLYIFVPENMLIQASAMRQCLAITIFLFAFHYINDEQPFRYSITILTASLIHISALFLLPVYFIRYLDYSGVRRLIPLFLLLYAGFFLYSGEIIPTLLGGIFSDESSKFERYAIYDEQGSLGSGLGIVFNAAYLTLLLYYYDQQREVSRLVFKMVIISIYLTPFIVEVSMIARFAYYFSLFSIAAIPIVSEGIKSFAIRWTFISIYLAYVVYNFYFFFKNPVWVTSYSVYQTIFSYLPY